MLEEALAKQELSHDLRVSELKAEAALERQRYEQQLSTLEERNIDLNLVVRDLESWKQGVLDRHQFQEVQQKQPKQWHFDISATTASRTVGRTAPKMPTTNPLAGSHDMEEKYSNWDREARKKVCE